MYHRFSHEVEHGKVSASTFRQQLVEIQRNFRVMPLAEVIRALRQRRKLPPHTIVITVDDGYRDFYTVAYPLLQEFRLPATVFVATDFVDRFIWLWPDVVAYALANSTENSGTVCRSLDINASDQISTDEAWKLIVDRCLSVTDNERRTILNRLLDVTRCGALPDAIPREYEPMSWDEIREVHANGIDIGGHTRSHPNLASVPATLLTNEILGCKQRIEQELDARIETFCYPNGTETDYNETVKFAVESSGYLGATAAFADSKLLSDPYALRRFSSGANMYQFRKALYGVEYCAKRVSRPFTRPHRPMAAKS